MMEPLARFAAKCRFNPVTGCVIWVGGKSSRRAGEGKTPVFWHEGKRWPARRWAAKFIHGLSIEGKEAQQTCAHPYCVQHVTTAAPTDNRRQFWLLIHYGYDDEPEEEKAERLAAIERALAEPIPDEGPESPPEWLVPYLG